MSYIKQLDAVRAIAVILVIIWHWFPYEAIRVFPLGNIGVDIFFVLSGFLITRILLLKRIEIEQSIVTQSKLTAIGKFMMRRSLRIFPIYYLVILVLIFGARYLPNPIPKDWPYYVSYLQNFLFYSQQSLPGGKVSPFWSLAVEEQFYLIWPWLLFFIPSKYLKSVLVSGIILGAGCYFLFPILLDKNELTAILPFTCLHAFCIGGLLSFLIVFKKEKIKSIYQQIKIVGWCALLIYVINKLFIPEFILLDRALVAVCTMWLLVAIITNSTHGIGWILNNSALISIGRVSYGIYVFHNFVPVSVSAMLHRVKGMQNSGFVFDVAQMIEHQQVIFFIICTFALLFISFSSFYLFERPLLNLKRYFE